jgi:glycine oxidase
MASGSRVAVVGGGIIGLSVTFELSKAGFEVTLFERNRRVGRGATAAALGGITPQSESLCRGPLRHIATWSTELYEEYVSRISAESGLDIPVVSSGQIQVAMSDEEMSALVAGTVPVWESEGFVTHVLEPLLGPRVAGSVLLPIEIALEPGRLVDGLLACLTSRKLVTILPGTWVTEVSSDERSATVTTRDGVRRPFDMVILASGLATRELSPLLRPKLYPMRGQAMELRSGAPGYVLNHHVYAANGGTGRSAYLVPRSDGRVAMGVTYEPHQGARRTVTRDIQAVLDGCAEVCPAVRSWQEIRRWSGIRPASVDGSPFIGFLDQSGRVIVSAGHQGLGVTLAPVTAHLVKALCELDSPSDLGRVGERERQAFAICSPARAVALPESHCPGESGKIQTGVMRAGPRGVTWQDPQVGGVPGG